MSPRPDYHKIRFVRLPPIDGLRPHRIALRLEPERGLVQRVSAGYQVWCSGEFREFARYDDDPIHDGILHRHKFTVDGPGEIDRMFYGVPLPRRGARITQDILENVASWAAQLPIDDVQELFRDSEGGRLMPAIDRLQEITTDEDGYEAAGLVIDSILAAGDDEGPECVELVPTHLERNADGKLTRVLVSVNAVPATGESIEGDERALITA